jgi:hypothetical protein
MATRHEHDGRQRELETHGTRVGHQAPSESTLVGVTIVVVAAADQRTSTSRAVSPAEDAVLELLTKRRAAPPPAADDAAATSTVLPADVAYIRERAAAVFAATRASVAASVRTARANADACRDAALLAAELATPTRSAALADELVLVAIGLARYVEALLAVLLAEPHVTFATLATYTRILGPERARDALLVLTSIAGQEASDDVRPSSPPAHEALVAVLVGASPAVWDAATAAATAAGTDDSIGASPFAAALRRGLIDVSLATMLHVASIEA